MSVVCIKIITLNPQIIVMANGQQEIEVRRIEIKDVEILTKYRLDYLEEMQGRMIEEYKAILEKELNNHFKSEIAHDRIFAYMAKRGELIISFGAMVIKRIPGDSSKPIYLEGDILNMFTIPQERRKGISSLILQELINEARRRGISKISLHTSKDGEKLYRKFGFSEPTYPVLELTLP
ncbi:MAG: GNAT family N-acetyltransferase [Bacteroidales bacterium]|nr:GNAT family N-acetyltransferase [Bacteroidales bacterium]